MAQVKFLKLVGGTHQQSSISDEVTLGSVTIGAVQVPGLIFTGGSARVTSDGALSLEAQSSFSASVGGTTKLNLAPSLAGIFTPLNLYGVLDSKVVGGSTAINLVGGNGGQTTGARIMWTHGPGEQVYLDSANNGQIICRTDSGTFGIRSITYDGVSADPFSNAVLDTDTSPDGTFAHAHLILSNQLGWTRLSQANAGSVFVTNNTSISFFTDFESPGMNTMPTLVMEYGRARFYPQNTYGSGGEISTLSVYGGAKGDATPGIMGDGASIRFDCNTDVGAEVTYGQIVSFVVSPASGAPTGNTSIRAMNGSGNDVGGPACLHLDVNGGDKSLRLTSADNAQGTDAVTYLEVAPTGSTVRTELQAISRAYGPSNSYMGRHRLEVDYGADVGTNTVLELNCVTSNWPAPTGLDPLIAGGRMRFGVRDLSTNATEAYPLGALDWAPTAFSAEGAARSASGSLALTAYTTSVGDVSLGLGDGGFVFTESGSAYNPVTLHQTILSNLSAIRSNTQFDLQSTLTDGAGPVTAFVIAADTGGLGNANSRIVSFQAGGIELAGFDNTGNLVFDVDNSSGRLGQQDSLTQTDVNSSGPALWLRPMMNGQHDGANSTIGVVGTMLQYTRINAPSEVWLYANGNKTVQVTSTGVTINGTLTATGGVTGSSGSVSVSGYMADTGGVSLGHALRISADSRVTSANGGSILTSQVAGFSSATAAANGTVNILTQGNITPVKEGAQVWTPGDPIFLSITVSGAVTNVQPTQSGQVLLRVGFAKSNTEMLINVGMPVILQ